MTNLNAIAIARAVPLFKQAAELHEEIQSSLAQYREVAGGLLDKAKQVGQALESAHLALKASNTDVGFDEVLQAHAPNIGTKQADKYRRFSRGDTNLQLTMPWEPRQIEDQQQDQRSKPAAWEAAWGFAHRMSKVFRDNEPTAWPDEQKGLLLDELRRIIRILENPSQK